jgi:predicted NBD/HSP70 family sugar kinase
MGTAAGAGITAGVSLAGTALTLIHTGRAPTRSALTDILGVTRATTGAITGELRALGLIRVEPGQGGKPRGAMPAAKAAQQGRPSHRLLPDPGGPVALVAQIHPGGFAVALVGLGAAVVARWRSDAPLPADPEQALGAVAAAAAALLRDCGRSCAGAAVAVPTAVTRPEGTAVGALYLGWPTGTKIRDMFAWRLADQGVRDVHGRAVACEAINDVNAIALAEHRHGAGRDSGHLLVVVAEHRGVGGALVLGGALYTGATGLALEVGHVSVDPEGRLCVCGNRGCLNVETDAERFLAAAGRTLSPGAPLLDQAVAVLRDGYESDPGIRAAADGILVRLGQGLAGLINVVNPDRVLLGGLHRHLLLAAPHQLREAVALRSPWGRGAGVPVDACVLDEAGLIGAAEVAWQPVLDNPSVLRG